MTTKYINKKMYRNKFRDNPYIELIFFFKDHDYNIEENSKKYVILPEHWTDLL